MSIDDAVADFLSSTIAGITKVLSKVRQGIDYVNDATTALQIVDNWQHAVRAKDLHRDEQVYNYLRKRCVAAYKTIKEDKSKEIILQYVDRDFLRVAPEKVVNEYHAQKKHHP